MRRRARPRSCNDYRSDDDGLYVLTDGARAEKVLEGCAGTTTGYVVGRKEMLAISNETATLAAMPGAG